MKIAIAGASGLIGTALVRAWQGGELLRIVRREARGRDELSWDPQSGRLDIAKLEGCDLVVNLAGENIASGRWNEQRKRELLDSRVQATRVISEAVARLRKPPVLINASAIGYYGSRGDEELTESSTRGAGFLADVCVAWEAAAQAAVESEARVVFARIGVVLAREGGALKQMLPPFRWGLGGVLGDGKQWMGWVGLQDVVSAIQHIATSDLRGPVNIVAPHPVTNRQFTKTLGELLHRPTILTMPRFAVRLLFGEMGDELLLGSTRALPQRLQESGYRFAAPDVRSLLAQLI